MTVEAPTSVGFKAAVRERRNTWPTEHLLHEEHERHVARKG
jgi:hypothetical protein